MLSLLRSGLYLKIELGLWLLADDLKGEIKDTHFSTHSIVEAMCPLVSYANIS